ncbi:centromere protein F-like isoform X2 [Heptranchias perlo]
MSSNCHCTSFLKSEEQGCKTQMQPQARKPTMADIDIQKLKEENKQLKYELEDLRWQYQQLLEERWNGHYDERRVTLLKAQIMQLERQVVLLTEGLSSRATQMLEIENALEPLNERFRSLLSFESPTSEVPVSRAELMQLIGMCQALQNRLQKCQTATSVENLSLQWLMSGRNLTKQPVTLLDLCYGRMDNLNLQHVGNLESKLCKLYRHLNAIKHTLSLILAPGQEFHEQVCHILPGVVYARLLNHVTTCNQSLEECCMDLLTLTLIVPSAPWVKLEHAVCQEFTVENMLSALPTFPKGTIQRQVKRAAEALVKAANYSRLMVMQQVKAQQVELDFHKSMYDIQVKYTEALFQGIKEAYRAFQDNVAKVLCLPLQEVLTSYANLKETASEAALRDFLTVFENNAEQMQDAVNALTPFHNQQSDGDEALSRFGKEFFLSLECCLKDCTDQRDSLTSKHETLKEEFNHALKTLQNLRKEKMEKRTDGGHSSQCASQSERPDEKVKVDEAASSPRDETREELNSLTAETTAATTASSLKQRSGALRMSNFTNKSVNTAFDSQDDPSKQCSSERHISQRRAKPAQKSKTKMIQQRPPWQD